MIKIQQSIRQQSLGRELKTFRLELHKCWFSFIKASTQQALHKRKERLFSQRLIFPWESNKLVLLKNFSVIVIRKFIEFQITNFGDREDCISTL